MENLHVSIVVIILSLLPLSALADHHGTRCPLDFQQYNTKIVRQLKQNHPDLKISVKQIKSTIQENIAELTREGKRRPHHEVVPIIAAAYSLPLNFATCQIELHKSACPAIKWCYPYRYNVQSLRCGKIDRPLVCKHEAQRCKAHPNSAECLHPPQKLENCLVHPDQAGCKEIIKNSEHYHTH